METRRIGKLEVGVVGIGCNNFGGRIDARSSAEVVHAALDAGATLFDTANTYGGGGGSEEALGSALHGRRDEAVVATKFGATMPDGASGAPPRYVRAACEESLRRLGTDRIDLFQLHRPDPDTPIADTLGAMSDLIDDGLVREIGCSNFGADRFDAAQRAAAAADLHRFASVQNERSLVHEEPDHARLVALLDEHDAAYLPYFPLASGLLTGKYTRGEEPAPGTRLGGSPRMRQRWMTPARLDATERLQRWAQARDHTLLELAVSWLVAQPRIGSVIAGATSAGQVQANVAAAGWRLRDGDLDEIEDLRAVAVPDDDRGT